MPRFGRSMLAHWALDPAITYLNHGTVGAPPRRVLEAQQAIRDQIELQPSRFLLRELTSIRDGPPRDDVPRMRVAAGIVAAFLGIPGEDLLFAENATTGANAVLRSFPLRAGDEILVMDLGYGGVTNAARYAARERGATVRTLELPWPIRDPAQVTEAIDAALRPNTRIAIVDHITSGTALLFPIADIAARCHAKGVLLLVDGAHAPGAIALDIPALGADWYVANLHKWMWTPRPSGIVWAAPARRADLHPTVISWGLDQGLPAEFDLLGTRDPSPHLAAPAALAFMRELGVDAVRAWNHDLAWRAGAMLTKAWGTTLETPERMVGTMIAVPLPASFGAADEDAWRLRDALLFEDAIEAPVQARRGMLWLRVSAQVYNDESDIERLAEAVLKRG